MKIVLTVSLILVAYLVLRFTIRMRRQGPINVKLVTPLLMVIVGIVWLLILKMSK